MANQNELLYKLLLIGDSGVGKSSLLLRFTDGSFEKSFISTIGVDFKIKKTKVDDKNVKLQIWDTAGQERFKTITSSYYRGAHGIIIVYDVTQRESFENVKSWMSEIDVHGSNEVEIVIVGNKVDQGDAREVSTEEGEQLANSLNVIFIEASAMTDEKVNEMFMMITRKLLKSNVLEKIDQSIGRNEDMDIDFDNAEVTNSSCC
ncbi:GTP-binding protein [Bonamia ostreae]|uniref:GTP-binding protein n=2 Tax=Bonamia ostreae TaxID=126728 RepID=A0ABV2AM11_9EUKA